ncbi:unnamed protein product [Linum trigynum]|uniref:Biotin carboxyl carrier protein of acetyl-CoA carboxylase n=1 Tax=Linum trigynum TaxID=586398 RepID=A0AAV2F2R7_9ROSI
MASISVPCPKTTVAASAAAGFPSSQAAPLESNRIAFPRASKPASSLSLGSTFSALQRPGRRESLVSKVQAKVTAKESLNNTPLVDTKSDDTAQSNGKALTTEPRIPDVASISEFMAQVSHLVKLVDSRDIVELKLKQLDCEIEIRKKEALPQPPVPAASPFMMMQSPYPQAMPQQPAAAPSAPAAASASSVPALPPPAAKPASSHHQLKCPMAGTFYRSPAPGEPAFVKVGDKVQKGQVLCIIEAMKLMNEIEADQSGTITEILVDDGKPVSVDLPLFAIAP